MFDRLVREGLEAGGVGKDEGVHRIAEVGEERVEAGGRVMSKKNNYNGKVPFSKLTAAAVEREKKPVELIDSDEKNKGGQVSKFKFSLRQVVKHEKTGKRYTIIGMPQDMVLLEHCGEAFYSYREHGVNRDDTVWVRRLSEMEDGRFSGEDES